MSVSIIEEKRGQWRWSVVERTEDGKQRRLGRFPVRSAAEWMKQRVESAHNKEGRE